jgi:hypothetical protein
MKYTKPALSLVDQADLLISRGMLGDREQIIRQLSAVNEYLLEDYSSIRISARGSQLIRNQVRFGRVNHVRRKELVMLQNGMVRGRFFNHREIFDSLYAQYDKSTTLEQAINANQRVLGYGG